MDRPSRKEDTSPSASGPSRNSTASVSTRLNVPHGKKIVSDDKYVHISMQTTQSKWTSHNPWIPTKPNHKTTSNFYSCTACLCVPVCDVRQLNSSIPTVFGKTSFMVSLLCSLLVVDIEGKVSHTSEHHAAVQNAHCPYDSRVDWTKLHFC